MDVYARLRKASINEDDANAFKASVPVEIYYPMESHLSAEDPSATRVTFTLDIEERDYGIKGIATIIRAVDPITYTETDRNSDKPGAEKKISIDPDMVKIEWVPGSGFYPQGLAIHIDERGMVDSVDISMTFFDPTAEARKG